MTKSNTPLTWMNPTIPGLFARLASHPIPLDQLDAALGPVAINLADPSAAAPYIPALNNWSETISTCRKISAAFPELAAAAGVTDPTAIDRFRIVARQATPMLVDQVMAAGELRVSVDSADLTFVATPLSPRAQLANEMLFALREGWRFMRCSHCHGWHRIQRQRAHSFCSGRCKTASTRLRQQEDN